MNLRKGTIYYHWSTKCYYKVVKVWPLRKRRYSLEFISNGKVCKTTGQKDLEEFIRKVSKLEFILKVPKELKEER